MYCLQLYITPPNTDALCTLNDLGICSLTEDKKFNMVVI